MQLFLLTVKDPDRCRSLCAVSGTKKLSLPLDKRGNYVYTCFIFYERTVNTMTELFIYSKQMPQKNINRFKHGVCPNSSAMC